MYRNKLNYLHIIITHYIFEFTETVLNNTKNCPRSQALFYDQLTRIISEAQEIHTDFIKNLTSYIEKEFVDTNMIDKTSYR